MNLDNARVAVVVFHMPGCPACEAYLPHFQRVAAKYQGRLPILILDASKETTAADHFKVQNVPVTMVVRKPVGAIRVEGEIPEGQVDQLFQTALRHA